MEGFESVRIPTMQFQELLRKLWQALSFVFVLYGFYLLFLFILDTTLRVNEKIALPVSAGITLSVMAVSGYIWARKHLKRPVKGSEQV